MGYMPQIPTAAKQRRMTDIFSGYRHQPRINDGEFYDMRNLSSDYFPLMSARKARGLVLPSGNMQGIMEMAEKLAYVENGTLYYAGEATAVQGLSEGEKQMVGMGAYICIFPDKVYYNTAEPTDHGSMEAAYSSTGPVKYSMCKIDGTAYAKSPVVSDTAPANPEDGALWVDSSTGSYKLLIYSAALSTWADIQDVYTKIEFITTGEISALFKQYDGVEISGSTIDNINGNKVIYYAGGGENEADFIVVSNLLKEAVTQGEGSVRIRRSVPEINFVCESQNRLWGCFYGQKDGKMLNEIYCCALGDFKNWNRYIGISTDSWTASVGADGEWTGAATYLGYPTFFKENSIHRITVSGTGGHRITETAARGVAPGSHRSLQVVNETLYYKSRSDVCAYQGAFPASVSDALGDEQYSDAVSGSVGDKYYISMRDAAKSPQLFVYDAKRGIWCKEDNLRVKGFAKAGDELYAIAEDGLWAMLGSKGDREAFVGWMAESGLMYYQYPDKKYVSRFNFRVYMEKGATFDVYIQYDSEGPWEHKGRVQYNGINTVTIPIRPRRCDHLRIRLEGKGAFKLYSIAKILEIGSDM